MKNEDKEEAENTENNSVLFLLQCHGAGPATKSCHSFLERTFLLLFLKCYNTQNVYIRNVGGACTAAVQRSGSFLYTENSGMIQNSPISSTDSSDPSSKFCHSPLPLSQTNKVLRV